MASEVDHRFRMEMVTDGGAVRIEVCGDFDRVVAAEFIVEGLRALSTSSRLVVDLCGASIVDSSALGALIHLRRRAEGQDRHFEVVIGARYQQVLFETSGVSEHLNIVSALPDQ